MLLEYFQMIDRIEAVDLGAKTLTARSIVPSKRSTPSWQRSQLPQGSEGSPK